MSISPKVYIVAGLGFGDEGKGTITEYLARRHQAETIVRYNGGAQASHRVVNDDDREHCFAQFSSGTFLPNVRSYLTGKVIVNPVSLDQEAIVLLSKKVPAVYGRLNIDEDSLITTPFHQIINRMLELSRGDNNYGSVGMGVGQTIHDAKILGCMAIRTKNLVDKNILSEKLHYYWQYVKNQAIKLINDHSQNSQLHELYQYLIRSDFVEVLLKEYSQIVPNLNITTDQKDSIRGLIQKENIVMEGSQAILLDHKFGFWPYVTKSNTTFAYADQLLDGTVAKSVKIGIIRSYMTRHGPGPMVTENRILASCLPDSANNFNPWQGPFRVGWLDLVALRYSLKVIGRLDYIAMTCLDRLSNISGPIKVCYSYVIRSLQKDLEKYFDFETINGKKFIQNIRYYPNPSQEHQQNLGILLSQCIPYYTEFSSWNCNPQDQNLADFLDFIQKNLNIKINILSFGPKYCDKIEI